MAQLVAVTQISLIPKSGSGASLLLSVGMSFPEKVKFRHALQIILGSVKLYLPCALPCISEDSLQSNDKAAVSEPPESVIWIEMGNDFF